MGDGNELSQLRQLGDTPLGAPGAISVDGIEVPVDQQCNINVWTPSLGDAVGALFGADTNDTCEGEPDISGGCAEIMNSDAIEALNAVVPGGIFPSGTTPDQYCSDLCSQSCYGAGGLAMWINGPCITEYAPVA